MTVGYFRSVQRVSDYPKPAISNRHTLKKTVVATVLRGKTEKGNNPQYMKGPLEAIPTPMVILSHIQSADVLLSKMEK